jgi:hypothetical protein
LDASNELDGVTGLAGDISCPWLGAICADAIPDAAPSIAALASKSFRIVSLLHSPALLAGAVGDPVSMIGADAS